MTEKPAPKNKPRNPNGNPHWQKGMPALNPKGRPRLGQSRPELIEAFLKKTPMDVAKQLGGRTELARHFKAMPPDVALLDLLMARVVSSVMFEPQPGLVNFLFDSLFGKIQNPIDVTSLGEKIEASIVVFQDASNNEDSHPAPEAPGAGDGGKPNPPL